MSEPYDKGKQVQRLAPAGEVQAQVQHFLEQQKKRPKLSALIPLIRQRGYEVAAERTAAQLELALQMKEQVPQGVRRGLHLMATRKAGRRIGPDYGLVTNEELFVECAQLVPVFCTTLGVPFDRGYLAQSSALVLHLQTNFPFLTIEEVQALPTHLPMIPSDKFPTAFQILDVGVMGRTVRAYVDHVFGKQAGPAQAWLQAHCITPEEREAARLRQSQEMIDPRYVRNKALIDSYPPDAQAKLRRVYGLLPPMGEMDYGQQAQAFERAAGKDAGMLADYITHCVLTLSKNLVQRVTARVHRAELGKKHGMGEAALAEYSDKFGQTLLRTLAAAQCAEWQSMKYTPEGLPAPIVKHRNE